MIAEQLLMFDEGRAHVFGSLYTGDSIDQHGNIYRFVDGVFHAEHGPAVEFADGYKAWYKHGNRHREDGPAIEDVKEYNEWYIHDYYITTWKEYHKLSTLSPEQQMIVKLKYGEQLK